VELVPRGGHSRDLQTREVHVCKSSFSRYARTVRKFRFTSFRSGIDCGSVRFSGRFSKHHRVCFNNAAEPDRCNSRDSPARSFSTALLKCAAGCEITPAQAPPCPSLPHSPSPSRDEHARAGRLSGCGMGATCGGADRRVVLLDRRGRAFYRQSGCDVVLVPGETWPFPGTWSEPLCLSCTRSGRHSTAG
jgi:hypothetical protein